MQSSKHDVPRFWRGCLMLFGFWLIVIIIAAIVWRVRAQPGTAVYIQHVIYRPNVGIAWCSGCPDNATKLNAYYYYGCCDVCPPAHGARLAIIRPGWQWNSDCDSDYNGYVLMGNENETSMTAQAMANWLISQRAIYQEAIFVCLNSYDLEWATAVMELLPPDTCQIIGVHIYNDVDITSHLDQICRDCWIWLTEIGYCNSQELYRMVQEARADSRVGMIYFYTAVGGINPCLTGIGQDGELTPVGQAFYEAVTESYP